MSKYAIISEGKYALGEVRASVYVHSKLRKKRKAVREMEKFLPFIKRNECCRILFEDIIYIEKNGRTLRIVTSKDSYYEYGTIPDYMQYLADDDRFFVCLKSLVINFDHVIGMKNQTIYFSNGKEYDLGRTNYLKAKQSFVNYLLKASQKSLSE